MAHSEPKGYGGISERGILNGFKRVGMDCFRGLTELVAGSLDKEATFIKFFISEKFIDMIDNGRGMDEEEAKNMTCLFRENWRAKAKRGVSGAGSKIAMSHLSEKQSVTVYTSTGGGKPFKIIYPWDKIYKEGKYTGNIKITKADDTEFNRFKTERLNWDCSHGTTIRFPYLDKLHQYILFNFKPVSWNDNLDPNPLNRISVVFGSEPVEIKYQHFEEPEKVLSLCKYDYFGAHDPEYYTGKTKSTIRVWLSDNASDVIDDDNDVRFIMHKDNRELEIIKKTGGLSRKPEQIINNMHGYKRIGEFRVTTGLRRDPKLFDLENPILPTSGAHFHKYDRNHIHKKDESWCFKHKLKRNGQMITTIDPSDTKIGSARASIKARLEYNYVQSEASYNPLSNQNNPMDDITGMQVNKNQNSHNFSKKFTRLLDYARNDKASEILNSWEELVKAAEPVGVDEAEVDEVEVDETDDDETDDDESGVDESKVDEAKVDETGVDETAEPVEVDLVLIDDITRNCRKAIYNVLIQHTSHKECDKITTEAINYVYNELLDAQTKGTKFKL